MSGNVADISKIVERTSIMMITLHHNKDRHK